LVAAGSIYAGTPARRIKGITEEMKSVIKRTAENYQRYAEWYK
jgi:carbonic anhydrase/acetyltransferase-like protein (isoleucine patch superfamily)